MHAVASCIEEALGSEEAGLVSILQAATHFQRCSGGLDNTKAPDALLVCGTETCTPCTFQHSMCDAADSHTLIKGWSQTINSVVRWHSGMTAGYLKSAVV